MDLTKKRVLIMANNTTGGGAERVADTQIRLLSADGLYDIAAATCGAAPTCLHAARYFHIKNFLDTPFTRATGTLGLGLNHSAMEECLRTYRPGIVHMHAFVQFSPSALKALETYKKETGCRIVLTHHTFSYVCPNDALFNYRTGKPCEKCLGEEKSHLPLELCYGSFVGSWGKYIQKKQFYRIFKRGLVDVHIAPGQFMKEKLQVSFPDLPVEVIFNPCLGKVSRTLPEKAPGKMVYFGRMSREKNVIAAVKAMEAISLGNVSLLLVGDGPESTSLEQAIAESSARDSICFLRSFLSREQLYPLIRDAQYYILPSLWYENSPVAMIEALDMGITPLVSDRGGMKELKDWADVGYGFDPEDTDSIVRAVRLAVGRREQDQMLLAGQLRDKLEAFAESTYLQQILALYHGLMEV